MTAAELRRLLTTPAAVTPQRDRGHTRPSPEIARGTRRRQSHLARRALAARRFGLVEGLSG